MQYIKICSFPWQCHWRQPGPKYYYFSILSVYIPSCQSRVFKLTLPKLHTFNAPFDSIMLQASWEKLTSIVIVVAILWSAYSKMSSEQRAAIKLCAGNGISVNKTIEMLCNVYGDAAMKTTAVYDWYRRFQNGRKDTRSTDDARTGRSKSITSSHVAQIKTLLDKDRRITIRELQDRVDCSYGRVFNIIHQDLNMQSERIIIPFSDPEA